MSNVYENGAAVCEEFARHTFCDPDHKSMLVNVSNEWVDKLINRMLPLGFNVIAKIEMNQTTTVVFSLAKIKA